MKKLMLSLILIIIVSIFAGCIGANTPQDTKQAQSSQESKGQLPQSTQYGTPSDIVKQNVPDFYDIYKNKVNPNDVIAVAKMPVQDDLIKPPLRLVREGTIDIELYFKRNQMPAPIDVVRVNKIPEPTEKLTYIRVKLYDQNGSVVYFRSPGGEETIDHLPDIRLNKGGAFQSVYDQASEAYGGIKEWEFFIYFIDISKVPTPVPQQTIKI